MATTALLYEEPSILTILIKCSFVLVLNLVGYCLDKLIYCGLVGQILIGMAWGSPGAGILDQSFESSITSLGYLGLILLVFEGGLTTKVHSLRKNLPLSILVAVTGVSLPIALSFSLIEYTSATKLQAFAAGCALCSTSLGTTFSVLKSCGLNESRLGSVLTVAAMLDDVVGLVMVQIIQSLGSANSTDFDAITVIRPVFVSIAFALLLLLLSFITKRSILPMTRSVFKNSFRTKVVSSRKTWFVASTLNLVAWITAGSYAGTSILFASYLAGVYISWLSAELNSETRRQEKGKKHDSQTTANQGKTARCHNVSKRTSRDVTESMTKIGQQDQHIAMTQVGKTTTQSQDNAETDWEQIASTPPAITDQAPTNDESEVGDTLNNSFRELDHGVLMYNVYYSEPVEKILKPFFFASIGFSIAISELFAATVLWRGMVYTALMTLGKLACGVWLIRFSSTAVVTTEQSGSGKRRVWNRLARYQPQSCYPALLLGSAMTARGEIGFLISAIAQKNGLFVNIDQDGPSIFLVVTWAILLCTIVGPVAVGLLAKRVRRLQTKQHSEDSRDGRDPLGIWARL